MRSLIPQKIIHHKIYKKMIKKMDTGDTNHNNLWSPNTILITSDAMLQNIDENRLCKGKFEVEV